MHYNDIDTKPIRWALAVGTALSVGVLGYAQDNDQDEDIFELSPFEVRGGEDEGYRATSTLAGTRIRTDLKDVGSAISVVTEQFLKDTGATGSESLLQYTTNTEVGGTRGNFGGMGDSALLDDSANRISPQSNTRIRGLAAADNTRNYYLTDIPWDSYNTSRIDIQRGPNSILFGNGSGAGIINGTVDGAYIGENSNSAEFRVGSEGSYRGSLNLNRVLIEDELAVRFATLYDKDKYQQDPSFNRDQRYYGAVRWEPKFLASDKAKTIFNISYEDGDISANRPRTTTLVDAFSPWFRTTSEEIRTPEGQLLGTIHPMASWDGYNPFTTGTNNSELLAMYPNDKSIGAGTGNDPSLNAERWIWPAAGNGVGGQWYGGFGAIFPDPSSSDMAYYYANSSGLTDTGGLAADGTVDGTIAGLRGPNVKGLIRFDDYTHSLGNYSANDVFQYAGQSVYRAQTITDPSVFDFYNHLIDGPNKSEWSEFDALNASIDQTFLDGKLGFQFAIDRQKHEQGRLDTLGGSPTLSVDVYSHLPVATYNSGTGLYEPLANPNFGRPFIVSTSNGNTMGTSERETWRFTPFADIDLQEMSGQDNIFTKILGRHVVTGLVEGHESTNENVNWSRYAVGSSSANALGIGGGPTGVDRRVVTAHYIGSALQGGSSMSNLNLSPLTAVQQPTNGQAWYFDSTWNATGVDPAADWPGATTIGLSANQPGLQSATQSENPANYVGWVPGQSINVDNSDIQGYQTLATSAGMGRDKIESLAVIDQWSLFDKAIVGTFGMRKDTIRNYRGYDLSVDPDTYNTPGTRPLNDNQTVDFSTPFGFLATPDSRFESDWLKSYSVVVHSPDSWADNLGGTLSAFYNKSDNFRPESRVGLLGTAIAPPTGETEDYGLMYATKDGKLSIKVNKYETNANSATLSDPGFGIRGRLGDELQRGMQFSLAIQNHVDNYRFEYLDENDVVQVSAYEPATGTAETWTPADWRQADSEAQRDAQAWLDSAEGITDVLEAWNLRPERFDPAGGSNNWGLERTQPSGLQVTGDTVSKGTEVEIFYRPTENWNFMFNASKTSAQRLNIASEVAEFIAARWEVYNNSQGVAELRWFGGGQGSVATSTGLARYGRNAYAQYGLFRSQEGNDVPELRPYRANLITNYNFTDGKLAGFSVGGAYRWQDHNVIGYGVTEVAPEISPVNPAIGKLDVAKPFHGPTEDAIDLWVGYNTNIGDNIDWRIQLNVRDALSSNDLVPVNTNPDGSIGSYRITFGPTWELTNSFDF